MPNTDNLRQNRPYLFSPSVVRSVVNQDIGTSPFQSVTYEQVVSSSLNQTSSFLYNLPGEGLRSTQQLPIDWSQFENHTFFNSAHVKTNVAFRKIFDQFPFDGTQSEFEIFQAGLTGFEKWVYDQFPKNTGYLFLSGTKPNEPGTNGTYVTIKDIAGVAYPGISRNITGDSILNPQLSSMTLEFWAQIPSQVNSASFLLHKVAQPSTSVYHGFDVALVSTSSTSIGKFNFAVFSGSYGINADISFTKGQWNHFAFIWDRSIGTNQIFGYLNGSLVSTSSQQELGVLNMNSADLVVGSGSATPSFTPVCTLSGTLDELRIWHVARTQPDRDETQKKSIFAQDNLVGYYKFNEPSGSQSPVVLDSSGNSLHGQLSTWAFSNHIREIVTGSIVGSSPVTYERVENNPILFPLHPAVEDLNVTLLDNARDFDQVNPNRIDRLIPKHYLLQGQQQDGLSTEEGGIVDPIAATGATPDTAKLGDTQVILMLLYTWAKFFDEIKLYTQAFSNLIQLDYDPVDGVPDTFLQFLADKYGIRLPPLFTDASINQFINAENLDNQISTNSYSLQYIQNQIWRRILLNLKDILRSKGTIHSIKSFIRAVGIDPDNNFRIREFGGPTSKVLVNVRENRSEVSTLVDFISGGYIQSPFLSGSRLQQDPGFPYIANGASYVNGISNNKADGFFTSGSWTVEGIYRFPTTSSLSSITQSLMRMFTTGSGFTSPGSLNANLVAITTAGLRFYGLPNTNVSPLVLNLSASNVFDGHPWYVSFGKTRSDIFGSVSSSYFLRAGRQEFGEIVEEYSASVWYNDNESTPGSNLFNSFSTTQNVSGTFLAVGSQSIASNNINAFTSASLGTHYGASSFNGRLGHLRFWSKALSENEWREHVRNFKSLGVDDATTNFNFTTNKTGSFEKLRFDVSSDQITLASDTSGFLQLTDFSQNNLNWSGSFPITSSVIVPQRFQYSLLSPKFDVGATTNKVRVRSFQNFENLKDNPYAQISPVYLINPVDRPTDDTRFTIDFSIVDALDQDIINIFSTLDIFDNVIGDPELMFSPDYPKLDVLRNIYFNRLTSKINIKLFFDFYKWFDQNIGSFISQLIPRKTKFLGTNFVIEGHMLDRSKIEYLFSDIYLGDSVRHAQKDSIFFEQISGFFQKY